MMWSFCKSLSEIRWKNSLGGHSASLYLKSDSRPYDVVILQVFHLKSDSTPHDVVILQVFI